MPSHSSSRSAASITIHINGREVRVATGTCVAAAAMNCSAGAGSAGLRESISGSPRGVLCGMGVCYECRVTIDGIAQQRSCMTECREGMRIETLTPSSASPSSTPSSAAPRGSA